MNEPSTKDAADAVKELTIDYEKLYGMDVVGSVHKKNDGIYDLCVVLEGNRGSIKACVQANQYQAEDINAARGLIPKLHQEFIKLLYRKVKEVIW